MVSYPITHITAAVAFEFAPQIKAHAHNTHLEQQQLPSSKMNEEIK